MEFIREKCKKCGYEFIIPEKTENVICGSCGNVNHYSKISSIVKKYNDTVDHGLYSRDTGVIIKPSGKTADEVPQNSERIDIPDDENEIDNPKEKSVSKIMTVVFILAPFIAMAVEFLKLPPYAVLIIIFIIIGIIFYFKKNQ